MNSETNERLRYYLRIRNSEQGYYLIKTALKNIDEFTTCFDDQFSLIEFLKKRYPNLNNVFFDRVEIAYQLKENIRTEDIIYKNSKVILNNQKLASIITNYLSHYSNIEKLDFSYLNNKYILEKMKDLLALKVGSVNHYYFIVNGIGKYLSDPKNYKTARDFAIFLTKQKPKFSELLANATISNEQEKGCNTKVEEYLTKMGMDQEQYINMKNVIPQQHTKATHHEPLYRFPNDIDDEDELGEDYREGKSK